MEKKSWSTGIKEFDRNKNLDGIEALKEQIGKDKEVAIDYFKEQ